MMKTKLLVVVLALCCTLALLAGLSIAQGQQTGNSNSGRAGNANRGGTSAGATRANNSADMKFAMTAAQDGMTEVELGRLAVQKGMSDAVKQFGQKMIDDHTNANQQLMQLATSKGMTLPTTLDAKHQAMVAKFQGLAGADFDRQYSKLMVKDHQKAVSLFQKEADRGADADLKAFASQTLPILQGHLSMAQSLNGGMGGGRGGNTNGNMSGGNSNRGGGSGTGNGNMSGNMNGNTGGSGSGGNSNRGRSNNRNSNSGGGNSNRGGNANNSNR